MGKYLAGHLLVAVVFLGCGSPLQEIKGQLGPPVEVPAGAGRVEMQYLGNGGWLIRRGGDVIATAPFVSNPGGLGAKVYLPGKPDHAAIEQFVPAMPDVKIMLIGHGHYDHAMDLPYSRRPHPTATRGPRTQRRRTRFSTAARPSSISWIRRSPAPWCR